MPVPTSFQSHLKYSLCEMSSKTVPPFLPHPLHLLLFLYTFITTFVSEHIFLESWDLAPPNTTVSLQLRTIPGL